ncbi:hypothetical protein FHL15_011329 [Xylaria flabelliformis]|uniref:DUF3431 domain-containing protein n=1 Tax=Xylaria flabelliformis TaxID=2512241 RepID=A0A553HIJ3_9PEZI|nr:hypothetical protein FHL15_011329 [Xylaria flabelliformis]
MVASLRSPRRLLVATFLVIALFLILARHGREYVVGPAQAPAPATLHPEHEHEHGGESHIVVEQKQDHELELVVASVKAENTSWFDTYLPDWHKNIYVADDPHAPLTVPRNKGREAMVYLTYIIDRYDDLPQNVLFVHASRFAWHNDDPDYDALPTLRHFRLPYLRATGYVNLRCVWVIGCPGEIRPAIDETKKDEAEKIQAKHIYKEAFEELLPEVPLPELVAVSCCSQFGVTRETLRSRPREDYIRYREWLLATPLDDALNGRVFEFAWHIIFGKEAVHCPSAAECYCNVFGFCDIPCSDDSCTGRYTLPPFSSLPKGWPLVGWQEEERNFTGPL